VSSYRRNRASKPVACKYCGKLIRFLPNGIPVSPDGKYYRPSCGGRETSYLMSNGKENSGVVASDGILGYMRHSCAPQTPTKRPCVVIANEKHVLAGEQISLFKNNYRVVAL